MQFYISTIGALLHHPICNLQLLLQACSNHPLVGRGASAKESNHPSHCKNTQVTTILHQIMTKIHTFASMGKLQTAELWCVGNFFLFLGMQRKRKVQLSPHLARTLAEDLGYSVVLLGVLMYI